MRALVTPKSFQNTPSQGEDTDVVVVGGKPTVVSRFKIHQHGSHSAAVIVDPNHHSASMMAGPGPVAPRRFYGDLEDFGTGYAIRQPVFSYVSTFNEEY